MRSKRDLKIAFVNLRIKASEAEATLRHSPDSATTEINVRITNKKTTHNRLKQMLAGSMDLHVARLILPQVVKAAQQTLLILPKSGKPEVIPCRQRSKP